MDTKSNNCKSNYCHKCCGSPCACHLKKIENLLCNPSYGLEEIKTEVANVESKLFSETFGIAEIKVEVTNIENIVSELRSDISTIEATLAEIYDKL